MRGVLTYELLRLFMPYLTLSPVVRKRAVYIVDLDFSFAVLTADSSSKPLARHQTILVLSPLVC